MSTQNATVAPPKQGHPTDRQILPSSVEHLRRHHGRHTEALSRFLGVWEDAHDADWWARPEWQAMLDLAVTP